MLGPVAFYKLPDRMSRLNQQFFDGKKKPFFEMQDAVLKFMHYIMPVDPLYLGGRSALRAILCFKFGGTVSASIH